MDQKGQVVDKIIDDVNVQNYYVVINDTPSIVVIDNKAINHVYEKVVILLV